MEWTELLIHYSTIAVVYVDELSKTDLMILLGTFLLGHYFGSKKNARANQAGN